MVTNTHITTPYSYSSFSSIEQIIEQARSADIVALGINDENTIDGFEEFTRCCKNAGIYPIYNIELEITEGERQHRRVHGKAAGIQNYSPFLGLALRCPSPFSADTRNLLASFWKQSQDRIWKMIDKINAVLEDKALPIKLDYNSIRTKEAKNALHVLHLSQTLQLAIEAEAEKRKEAHQDYYRRLFKNEFNDLQIDTPLHCRHELHTRLFSPGKVAFVPRQSMVQLSMHRAKEILLQAESIPCYQCTLDDDSSPGSPQDLKQHLTSQNIHAIEFITRYAPADRLAVYMRHFDENGFCVTVGTGCFFHEDPAIIPCTIDGKPLNKQLTEISFRGTCILAAHQECHTTRRHGFVDTCGNRLVTGDELNQFIVLGAKTIEKYSQNAAPSAS